MRGISGFGRLGRLTRRTRRSRRKRPVDLGFSPGSPSSPCSPCRTTVAESGRRWPRTTGGEGFSRSRTPRSGHLRLVRPRACHPERRPGIAPLRCVEIPRRRLGMTRSGAGLQNGAACRHMMLSFLARISHGGRGKTSRAGARRCFERSGHCASGCARQVARDGRSKGPPAFARSRAQDDRAAAAQTRAAPAVRIGSAARSATSVIHRDRTHANGGDLVKYPG